MGAGRRRSRRFLCFGPVAESAEEEAAAAAAEISSSSSTGSGGGLEPELRRKRPRLLRRISRFLRSASTLGRSGRSREDRSRSLPQMSFDALPPVDKSSDGEGRRPEAVFSSSSSNSSSSSSSSSACFSSSLLSSASTSSSPAAETTTTTTPRRKRMPPNSGSGKTAPERRIYDTATGLCLLLVSLFVMVFCGRLCAIMWTSTWLCLVLRRNAGAGSPPCGQVAAESVSPELPTRGCDKKRVVLEGLLQRSRRV